MEYGKITWTVQASTADGGLDTDLYPDISQVQGFVNFTPETWVHKPSGSWAVVEKRVAEIVGDRLTYQGEDGIWLEASVDPLACKSVWYWLVEFDLYYENQRLDLPAKKFALHPGTSVDLSSLMCAPATGVHVDAKTLGAVWADPDDAPPPEVADGLLWLKTNGDVLYYKESA